MISTISFPSSSLMLKQTSIFKIEPGQVVSRFGRSLLPAFGFHLLIARLCLSDAVRSAEVRGGGGASDFMTSVTSPSWARELIGPESVARIIKPLPNGRIQPIQKKFLRPRLASELFNGCIKLRNRRFRFHPINPCAIGKDDQEGSQFLQEAPGADRERLPGPVVPQWVSSERCFHSHRRARCPRFQRP